jgi:hypothetical protein
MTYPIPRDMAPPRAEIVRLPGDRLSVTGTVGQVGQMLAQIEATGRLVSASMPSATGIPGQVMVNVRLAPRQRVYARQVPQRRRMSKVAVGAIAGGAVTVVGMVGWLIWTLTTAVVDNASTVVGWLVLAVIVLGALGGIGGKTFSGTFKGSMD